MDKNNVISKLDQLAEFKNQRDALDIEKQKILESLLAPIKEQMAQVDVEFSGKSDAVNQNITNLEDEIRKSVLELGESVKGKYLHAVWAKGRVSWDTKFLDGYVISHPELQSARKEGDPSVSLRAAK